MKLFFYFVRHGETEFNKVDRLQGFCDSPLTEQGKQEARQARDALKEIPFTRAYSSSLPRALDTAKIILENHDISLTPMEELKEYHYGSFDGQYIKDIMDDIRARSVHDSFLDVGGDDEHTLQERMNRGFEKMIQESQDGDHILVVSHGYYGMHTIKFFFGLNPREIPPGKNAKGMIFPNGGIMKFAWEDGWQLISLPSAPEDFVDEDGSVVEISSTK